jgi:hypothetical protein
MIFLAGIIFATVKISEPKNQSNSPLEKSRNNIFDLSGRID